MVECQIWEFHKVQECNLSIKAFNRIKTMAMTMKMKLIHMVVNNTTMKKTTMMMMIWEFLQVLTFKEVKWQLQWAWPSSNPLWEDPKGDLWEWVAPNQVSASIQEEVFQQQVEFLSMVKLIE